MKKVVVAINIISLLLATGFDTEDGAPIRQGVHIEWYRTIAPGHQGEAIFVWSDTRYGMRNIFAHKINQDGEMVWGETGAVITDLPGRQEDPVAITDGNGGAFIAWVDYRFDAQGDIFIQHVDTNGDILLDPSGIALAQVEGKQITINMCTDSLGGVFVTWQDKRGDVDDDIYGTHVSANHDIISPGTGVPIVVEGGNQNAKSIEYAGNNEAFIAWADFRQGANADIYGQRLDVDMGNIFEENGFQIAGTDDQELKPRATYVNNSISLVAWKQGDENSKVIYQFVDASGLMFSDPKSISDNTALQTGPRVKRSSIGEVFVNWKDLRDDPIDGDQYFQKIDVNGERQWGDGIRVDPVEDVDFSVRFSAGNDGDLNVVWERGTFPEIDIMFQNINSDGNYSLDAPIAISNAPGYQFSPILSGNSDVGLYAVYGDQSSGSIDLKVQYLSTDYQPVWSDFGLTAMIGLDGDVNYTSPFRIADQDLYFIWEDNRATKKLFGTQITNTEIQYDGGRQITFGDNSSSETDFSTPIVARTDAGIYTATFDGSSSPKFIRINKLDEQLNNVWDSSGVALSAVFDMRSALLVEIGNSIGCFWSESRGFNYDIYYQKLDENGNITLDSEGVELVDSNGDDYIMAVVPTPDEKYMIFWMEDAWPAASLMYSKIDAEGNTEIGWNPNGNSLSNSSYDSRYLQVKPIGDETGLLAVWMQDGNFSDIYAQAIDWDGNIQWVSGGVTISDAENDQGNIDFNFNDAGTRSLLVWEDYRNGSDFEIFGQVLDLGSGTTISEPIQFSMDTTDQYNPSVTFIQDNEFLIIWEDERGYYNDDPLLINGVDLYGSGYVIGQGMTTEINGVSVCIAYHRQQNVNVTHHGGSEYFLDWIDYRSSGKEDLANYYGRTLMKAELLSSGTSCYECDLPKQFSLKTAYPNPFNGKVNFDFQMAAKEPVEFRIYDLNGRIVTDRLILPGFGGNYRIIWDGKHNDGAMASSGIYLYEFKTTYTIQKGKITYLK